VSGLLDLADRMEKATGDDLFLLREVGHVAFGWDGDSDNVPTGMWRYERWLEKGAFIEAMLTLVPEGMVCALVNCDAETAEPDFSKASAIVGRPLDTDAEPITAATPALALGAAVLRARAAA